MAPRKPRGLSKDEQDLWRRVADTAAPLHPNRPPKFDDRFGADIRAKAKAKRASCTISPADPRV